jgi:hypothetical protein
MLNKIKEFFMNGKPAQAATFTSESELVPFEKRMKHLENYFKRNSETNASFIPEFEASAKINGIALKDNVTENDIEEVVQIFNESNLKPHYNGSGWLDLKILIHGLIVKHGLIYEDLPNGNIELHRTNNHMKVKLPH